MKRLWIVLCLLLLWGCSEEKVASSGETALPEPTGAYIAEHPVESTTNGAVRAYAVGGDQLIAFADGIAVGGQDGKLTLYDFQDGKVLHYGPAMTQILATNNTCVYYAKNGVTCYDFKTEKTRQWTIPEDAEGQVAVGIQTEEIYYCTTGKIYALDMNTGISRLLKTHSAQEQQIVGAYLGGTVLGWKTEAGMSYISTTDGSLVSQEQGLQGIYTLGQSYLVQRMDGIVEQLIACTDNESPVLLNLPMDQVLPAFPMNGVLQITPGLELALYDLTSGRKTAFISLPEAAAYMSVAVSSDYVWILTSDTLYRWDPSQSCIEDETVYTSQVYSLDNPDPVAMAQCKDRADKMGQDYGVRVHIGADAVKQYGQPTLIGEHQSVAIHQMLDQLEVFLQNFPSGFLRKTVTNGWIHFLLVRHVDHADGFLRFWKDGHCYLAIGLDTDMSYALWTGLGGAVDSHILGHSRDLEYWNKANPRGFAYLSDGVIPDDYAEYVGVYFTEQRAMTYPNEDRASIFYYAVMPGNEELFAQEALQKKLKMFCEGIREAYDLKKSTDTFIWEQYLESSLAYTK